MKVSIGMTVKNGPWGGGNQFSKSLVKYLESKGVEVFLNLEQSDLDIILLMDPRLNSRSASYQDREIFDYLTKVNKKAIVVHRINECDERKGTRGVNQRLLHANLCADHTVFVASWLRNLFLDMQLPCQQTSVILNGSERTIFNPKGYQPWQQSTPLKFLTHHWGGHWMKGFDIYQRLDKLLEIQPFTHSIDFTYIGNLPKDFQFKKATHINPYSGKELANLIRQHHVYITASRNEPGSNHQNEGANCGLPLLYRESGCLPEYCQGFGIPFNENNFEEKVQEMIDSYETWVGKMVDYPHRADKTCQEYYDLFINLLDRREQIIKERNQQRYLSWLGQGLRYHPKQTIKYLLKK